MQLDLLDIIFKRSDNNPVNISQGVSREKRIPLPDPTSRLEFGKKFEPIK